MISTSMNAAFDFDAHDQHHPEAELAPESRHVAWTDAQLDTIFSKDKTRLKALREDPAALQKTRDAVIFIASSKAVASASAMAGEAEPATQTLFGWASKDTDATAALATLSHACIDMGDVEALPWLI